MKKNELIAYVESLCQPLCEAMGLELYDVDYEKEGPDWYLKIYLDKEGGIFINDCADFSHALEKEIEKNDPIENPYVLEVSSPGLDRPLKKDKDFQKNLGKAVEVKLYKLIEGFTEKAFTAELSGYDAEKQDVVLVMEDGSEKTLNRKDISGIRLAVIF